jgi:hypothetical protein
MSKLALNDADSGSDVGRDRYGVQGAGTGSDHDASAAVIQLISNLIPFYFGNAIVRWASWRYRRWVLAKEYVDGICV